MQRTVFPNAVAGAAHAAAFVAGVIRARAAAPRGAVLGLATGSSMGVFYRELIRLHREENLSFASVTTFNLDEYYPIAPTDPASFNQRMRVEFFDHVDLPPAHTHIPDATPASPAVLDDRCRAYESSIAEAGGIDIQLLGIGRNGHIGFNEPGSPADSRTRLVALEPLTRRDAQGQFGSAAEVPRHALTMGIATILAARTVLLLAWGDAKADAVRRALVGPIDARTPASFLRGHPDLHVLLDRGAASRLEN